MRKSDLDREVAQETGSTQAATACATALFLQKIMEAVARGEPVVLPGFGKFVLTKPRLANTSNLAQYKGAESIPSMGRGSGVHFSKSRTDFSRALRQHKERQDGQARSR
jgi:nucleoid DNA-binding protein